jgi:hypothetical protein
MNESQLRFNRGKDGSVFVFTNGQPKRKLRDIAVLGDTKRAAFKFIGDGARRYNSVHLTTEHVADRFIGDT